jgi:hypothetical protein
MGAAADLLGLPSSAATVLRELLTSAIAEGIKVLAWARGSPTRSIYRSMADFGKAVTDAVGQVADQGILSSSSGDGTTLVAKEVYGIIRPEADYATTTLLITNTGGGEYPWSPDNPLILTSTITKKQYISQGSGVIGALAVDVPLPIIAQDPGSSSTALPGQIDAWVSSTDGLTINQPNPAIGTDRLSDDETKSACTARVGFVPTASTIGAGGAPGAYESVARSGVDGGGGVVRPDSSRISVTRVKDVPYGAGGLIVYVADADGAISPSDLALVEAAILTAAKPKGIPVAVANATNLNISCTLTVWIGASTTADDDTVKGAINLALAEYLRGVQIGGYDLGSGGVVPLRGGLEEAAAGEAPTPTSSGSGAKSVAKLIKVLFATPSGDTTVAANEVPVLSGTPTITVNRVSGA